MSTPPKRNAYDRHNKALLKVSQAVTSETMLEAEREIHEQKVENVDDISQCGVSCDGTWHKRGHSSMNGCVATLSMETGKCLDVKVLSKVCHGCQGHENQQDTEEKRVWQVEHVGKCKANYTGSELSKSFSASLQFA